MARSSLCRRRIPSLRCGGLDDDGGLHQFGQPVHRLQAAPAATPLGSLGPATASASRRRSVSPGGARKRAARAAGVADLRSWRRLAAWASSRARVSRALAASASAASSTSSVAPVIARRCGCARGRCARRHRPRRSTVQLGLGLAPLGLAAGQRFAVGAEGGVVGVRARGVPPSRWRRLQFGLGPPPTLCEQHFAVRRGGTLLRLVQRSRRGHPMAPRRQPAGQRSPRR